MADSNLVQDLRQYLGLAHKRRALILTCMIVSMIGAVLYNYTTRPLYQATAQILINRQTPNILPNKELMQLPGSLDYLQTEYQLLGGRTLAERVIAKLNLQKHEEFKTGPLMSPWERFQRKFMGRTTMIVDSDGIPLSPAVAAYRSRLKIEPVPGSMLVNIRFTAYYPPVAADVVNALAQLYIEQSLEFRYTTSSEATGWLSDRMKEQQTTLGQAERALQAYREREGLVNVEERQGLADQKLTALNSALMSARTERIAKESLLSQIRAMPLSQIATVPLMLNSAAVAGVRSQLSDLQREQARLAETLGDKHPDMVRIRGQIRNLEDKITSEVEAAVRALQAEVQTARQQEASLQANLDAVKRESLAINRKAIEYGVLKREAETNQELFQSLMTRSKETGLETELKNTNIRIVEKAEVPRTPILPKKTQNYQWALAIGLALGIGLALFFEHLDNTFKTPDDVKLHLGLPFLGMVPDVTLRSSGQGAARTSPLILRSPRSSVAEAYRVLRTNLIFSLPDRTGHILVVSSANPGEGKTTTVANLAASLAMNGARVLAIDADLRRPTMHQHFGLAKVPGLSDLIVGKCKPSEAIHKTQYGGLQVLPCGYVPPNPTELLGSASLREVLGALRGHYDWLLIDTPPVLAMADTAVLCPVVDGVALVIGAEQSTRPAVTRAVDQIRGVSGRILGIILNKVNFARNSYYYGQYYGEYYRSYYAERHDSRLKTAEPRSVRRM